MSTPKYRTGDETLFPNMVKCSGTKGNFSCEMQYGLFGPDVVKKKVEIESFSAHRVSCYLYDDGTILVRADGYQMGLKMRCGFMEHKKTGKKSMDCVGELPEE